MHRYDKLISEAHHALDAASYALGTSDDETFVPSADDASLYLMQAHVHTQLAVADALHRLALAQGAW